MDWRDFFKRYIYKEGFQDMLREEDLSPTGNVDELIDRLVEEAEYDFTIFLDYFGKDDLKEICEDFDLPVSGTKDNLMERLFEEVIEISEGDLQWMGIEIEDESGEGESEPDEPLRSPDTGPRPGKPPEVEDGQRVDKLGRPLRRSVFESPPDDQQPLSLDSTRPPDQVTKQIPPKVEELKQLTEFIDHWRPSKRFRSEQAYEIELAAVLRSRFGQDEVKTQVSIYRGRIDIEALGIGIEIKMPETRSDLQRLLGQIWVYEHTYGPNLIVVIFHDFAKVQDVAEFRNALESHGVPVLEK